MGGNRDMAGGQREATGSRETGGSRKAGGSGEAGADVNRPVPGVCGYHHTVESRFSISSTGSV